MTKTEQKNERYKRSLLKHALISPNARTDMKALTDEQISKGMIHTGNIYWGYTYDEKKKLFKIIHDVPVDPIQTKLVDSKFQIGSTFRKDREYQLYMMLAQPYANKKGKHISGIISHMHFDKYKLYFVNYQVDFKTGDIVELTQTPYDWEWGSLHVLKIFDNGIDTELTK